MKLKNKIAFSLIELLISLIVISLIAAAFAPVISKKLKSGGLSIGVGFGIGGGGSGGIGGFKLNCTDDFGSDCRFCSNDECIVCSKSCTGYKEYVDNVHCSCEVCDIPNALSCAFSKELNTTVPSVCENNYYISGSTCAACKQGRVCDGLTISDCAFGQYLDEDENCQTCESGFKCDGTNIMPCPKGTYQDQEGQQNCLACPDNTYSDEEGSTECVACTPHCTNCNKTTGVCSACQDGYDLENGICKYNATFKTVKIDGVYWTTKNAGDYDGPQIPDDVNIYYVDSEVCVQGNSSTSATCGGSVPTCWQGRTSVVCGAISSTGYSGCNRTVCNWQAANLICPYNNMTLPTTTQLASLRVKPSANSIYNQPLVDFCDNLEGTTSYSLCSNSNPCKTSYNNYCYPNNVWSLATGSNGYSLSLDDGIVNGPATFSKQYAMSVRCTSTSGGFDCPSHCSVCDTEKCYRCDTGYTLNAAKTGCIPIERATVTALVRTAKNAGDVGGPQIPDTVNVYNTNTATCTKGNSSTSATCGSTVPTCWQGTTSTTCNASSSTGYSGCSRTVCNWYAANLICPYNGMTLPSTTQLSSLRETPGSNSAYNQYVVDLCGGDSGGTSYSRCGGTNGLCVGTQGSLCDPDVVWGPITGSNGYYLGLNGGSLLGPYSVTLQNAFSVRCVSTSGNYICPANCQSCNAQGCTKCNTGYALNSYKTCTKIDIATVKGNTWTTKNAGDPGGPLIPDSVNIYNIDSSTCTIGATSKSVFCGGPYPICWQGTTGGSGCNASSSSGYSGCSRTVCNWYAANLICPYNGMLLPTTTQLASLQSNTYYNQYAVDLCDSSASNSSYSNCNSSNLCYGAYSNWCGPYRVWSNPRSSAESYTYNLGSNKWTGPGGYLMEYSLSVRCVY